MRLTNGETLLRWPLAQHILTQGWNGGSHNGIDLRCTWGGTTAQPVYAAEDGTVDWVQTWDGHTKTGNQSYGNCVRLVHTPWNGGQLKTLYAHLSSVLVKSGQTVQEGQLIGYTGNTGNSYGAHLHFEVWWNGKRTNPLVWLDSDFTLASADIYTYGPGEHAVEIPADDAAAVTPGVPSPAAPDKLAAQMQLLLIGPLAAGDAAACDALATRLGLPSMGRYATLTASETAVCKAVGAVSSGDALQLYRLAQANGWGYTSKYVEV